MYRAITLAVLEQNTPLDNPVELTKTASQSYVEFARQGGVNIVLLNGRDVTCAIRRPEVTAQAHKLASLPAVRELLVQQQRQIGSKTGSLVTEGRDQGTVVFPQAEYKFYLDACSECRARRRQKQLEEQGDKISYEEILTAQQQRDHRDTTRSVGPLKPAQDAITIDTSDMTINQVVETIMKIMTEN